MRVILASGSPRRKALLAELGMNFEVWKPDADESHSPDEAPEGLCVRLSRLKAEAGARAFPEALVIAADTIVVAGGQVLGKPEDRQDAARMLGLLEGREHEVITGVCVHYGGKVLSHAEHTTVKFRHLTSGEIAAYVATGECDDKAGAYAVQGRGSLLIEGLKGDYFNVVGLPVCALGKMLGELGVKLESLLS